MNGGQVSIRHGPHGAGGVPVSEQAGGPDVVGQARRRPRKGASLVVSGAVDSALCPWGWTAHLAEDRIGLGDDPGRAHLPFSADARGHAPGEGGTLLVLGSADAARARDARVCGTAAGYAATVGPALETGGGSRLGTAEPALADAEDLTRSTSSSPTAPENKRRTVPRRRRSPSCSGRTASR